MVVLSIIVRHFLFVLFFGRSTLSSIGRSHVGSTNEDQKRLAHDVVHTSATRRPQLFMTSQTHCQTQNDGAYGLISMSFKRRFFDKLHRKSTEKLLNHFSPLSVHFKGPSCFFASGFLYHHLDFLYPRLYSSNTNATYKWQGRWGWRCFTGCLADNCMGVGGVSTLLSRWPPCRSAPILLTAGTLLSELCPPGRRHYSFIPSRLDPGDTGVRNNCWRERKIKRERERERESEQLLCL